MKSRGVYETPGGTLLYAAHSELEQLVLDRRTLAAKDLIAPRYADLVYEGRWWTTEREAYDAFVNVTQERITGSVTLRLYKGRRRSWAARACTRSTTSASSRSARTTCTSRAMRPGFIRLFASLGARCARIKDQELARRGKDVAATAHEPSVDGRAAASSRAERRVTTVTRAARQARSVAQALGRALRRWPRAGARRAEPLDRRRFPALAVRHPPVEGVGRGPLGRRACSRSRRARRIERGLDAVATRLAAGEHAARRPTKTCTR